MKRRDFLKVTGIGAAGAATLAAPAIAQSTANQAQLSVQLKRRSDGSIVWEGRAREPIAAGAAVPPATVSRLAAAMFRDFPGESGRTIQVK